MDIGHRIKILQNETVWANAAKMTPEAWYGALSSGTLN